MNIKRATSYLPCISKFIRTYKMTSNPFTYHKQKTIQALRYHFISRKEIKMMMVLVNVFSLATAVFFYLKKISPFAFLISSLLWLTMMVIFWLVMPRLVFKRSKTFAETLLVTFNNSDFSLHIGDHSRSFDWGSCSQWMESPHFFHIYFNERSFFLIPKDAFEDESAAREILKGKIKNKK